MTPDESPTDNSSLTQLAAIPDLDPGPLLRVSDGGVIEYLNPAARDMLGGDLRGKRWADVCALPDTDFWSRAVGGAERLQHDAEIHGRRFTFSYRRMTGGGVVIFGTDSTILRRAEEGLQKSGKLATLGTLAAGVAHELNNPASAAERGASQLRNAFARFQDSMLVLSGLQLTDVEAELLRKIVQEDRERTARASMIDPLTRSDHEQAVEDWLVDWEIADAWELAPALVSLGYDPRELARLADEWGGRSAAVIAWIARAQPVLSLAREVEESARRIAEIVKALKTYSFRGAATAHAVEITDGIESTLVMMRSKLRVGINVVRQYAKDLPPVDAYGAELNQVWTNLIDNAIDALGGRGIITIRTRADGDDVEVEFEDDGPGIPEDQKPLLFQPFFTTKQPGAGTGLGLSTSRNIVRKHGGSINVVSRPGSTKFMVRLPVSHRAADAPAASAPPARAKR
jgi:signal transduction histidine kinase